VANLSYYDAATGSHRADFFLARATDDSHAGLALATAALQSGPGKAGPLRIDSTETALDKDQSSLTALNVNGLVDLNSTYALALSAAVLVIFVFGLVLLAGTARRLLVTVSAFTLGHSITLTLAALGIVDFPSRVIEVAIAASILALAVELARRPAAPTLVRRRPWTMAAAFGLLHGLGFAAALREAGLPAGEIPLALLSFNVGIEIGQVLFVLGVLALGRAAGRLPARLPAWARRAPVYGMGSLAGYWFLERAIALVR